VLLSRSWRLLSGVLLPKPWWYRTWLLLLVLLSRGWRLLSGVIHLAWQSVVGCVSEKSAGGEVLLGAEEAALLPTARKERP
jgi:hypothetical protein